MIPVNHFHLFTSPQTGLRKLHEYEPQQAKPPAQNMPKTHGALGLSEYVARQNFCNILILFGPMYLRLLQISSCIAGINLELRFRSTQSSKNVILKIALWPHAHAHNGSSRSQKHRGVNLILCFRLRGPLEGYRRPSQPGVDDVDALQRCVPPSQWINPAPLTCF